MSRIPEIDGDYGDEDMEPIPMNDAVGHGLDAMARGRSLRMQLSEAHELLREAQKATKEALLYAEADNELKVLMYPQSIDMVKATLQRIEEFLQ